MLIFFVGVHINDTNFITDSWSISSTQLYNTRALK